MQAYITGDPLQDPLSLKCILVEAGFEQTYFETLIQEGAIDRDSIAILNGLDDGVNWFGAPWLQNGARVSQSDKCFGAP